MTKANTRQDECEQKINKNRCRKEEKTIRTNSRVAINFFLFSILSTKKKASSNFISLLAAQTLIYRHHVHEGPPFSVPPRDTRGEEQRIKRTGLCFPKIFFVRHGHIGARQTGYYRGYSSWSFSSPKQTPSPGWRYAHKQPDEENAGISCLDVTS